MSPAKCWSFFSYLFTLLSLFFLLDWCRCFLVLLQLLCLLLEMHHYLLLQLLLVFLLLLCILWFLWRSSSFVSLINHGEDERVRIHITHILVKWLRVLIHVTSTSSSLLAHSTECLLLYFLHCLKINYIVIVLSIPFLIYY